MCLWSVDRFDSDDIDAQEIIIACGIVFINAMGYQDGGDEEDLVAARNAFEKVYLGAFGTELPNYSASKHRMRDAAAGYAVNSLSNLDALVDAVLVLLFY